MTHLIPVSFGTTPHPSLLIGIGTTAAVFALALTVWAIRRRGTHPQKRLGGPAVKVAAVAALGCTAYSADTSWRFAADYLDMAGTAERVGMFAAAELALFATALMARQNLATQGAPGLPGTLVWVITGVQVIPAYAESGPVGGTVRAFVGPVMAAMLWHLAMGIELRLRTPGAASHGLIAVLGREARERLLSRLGIAARDRDAAQITRDRATSRAVALAARLAERTPEQQRSWRGRRLTRRLSKAVGRASVGTDPLQRAQLLDQLAARRHALALATVPLPSPWSPVQSTVTAAAVPSRSASKAPVPVGGPHGPDELDGDRGPSTPRGPVPQVGPAQTPDQRTNPAPDHAEPTLRAAQEHAPASADHDAPADQGHLRTTDQPAKPASADQVADHDAPAADRRTASDQQEATREKRTSIATGHTADSLSLSADHEHADHESGPAEEPGAAGADHGSPADQDRLRTTDHAERTTDQPTKSALADHDAPAPDQRTNPAPDQPADHDEDDSSGGPNGARATDHSGSPDAPRTKPADQEDEVPWEVKVEVARKAALEEGRMTRRAIRPHLRRHNISISHALFSDLQAALYADPALAHLPRETRRKTR